MAASLIGVGQVSKTLLESYGSSPFEESTRSTSTSRDDFEAKIEYGAETGWDVPSLNCTECGKENVLDGFTPQRGNYYGKHYCAACWDIWIDPANWPEIPVPVPAVTDRSFASRWNSKQYAKRSKRFFGESFRLSVQYNCCAYPEQCWCKDESGNWTWSPIDWGSREPIDPSLDLVDLSYIDAHCHLDHILQNKKHGGPGWDCKQRLCKYWLLGPCPWGAACEFAHGKHQMESRVPLELEDVQPFMEQHFRASNKNGAKLKYVVTNCCELSAIDDTRFLVEVADKIGIETLLCTFGCHPHNYREYDDDMETRLVAEFEACGPRAVAWGECGLDYCKNYEQSQDACERRKMIEIFARQACLAAAKKLPLVVHTREAEEDTMQILRDCLPRDHKVHIHAFQGSVTMLEEILDLMPNSVFGVSNMIMLAYPVEAAVEIALHCPLDRLVLETDAPYLASGPRDIMQLATKVAELKGVSVAEVLAVTSANSLRLYLSHSAVEQTSETNVLTPLGLYRPQSARAYVTPTEVRQGGIG